jgi:hypothetical protein
MGKAGVYPAPQGEVNFSSEGVQRGSNLPFAAKGRFDPLLVRVIFRDLVYYLIIKKGLTPS